MSAAATPTLASLADQFADQLAEQICTRVEARLQHTAAVQIDSMIERLGAAFHAMAHDQGAQARLEVALKLFGHEKMAQSSIALLPPGTIVYVEDLEKVFGLSDQLGRSIRNMIKRGELPAPARIDNKPCWTVGAILKHIDKLLAAAQCDQENGREELQAMIKKHGA
jgi:hypothetical protein